MIVDIISTIFWCLCTCRQLHICHHHYHSVNVTSQLMHVEIANNTYQCCLDSPPHPLVNPSLSSSITLSLQTQNLPFQQVLPTLHFFCLLDCLHDNGTGPIMLISLSLVSHYNFLFVPCGTLSWLPVSFLLHVKYTLSATADDQWLEDSCNTL